MNRIIEDILNGHGSEINAGIKRPYRLVETVYETPTVKKMRFKSDIGEKLTFKPGQFVEIGYSSDGSKIDVQRPYSIGSAPGSDTMEFYIGMVGGKLTSILEKAKAGDIYNISMPLGKNFEYVPGYNKKSLFLAAATGIAPFMSMLKYIEKNGIDEDIVLIYSVKTDKDVICARELKRFDLNGVAKVVVTLTRQEWEGEKGRINEDKIKRYAPDIKDRTVYLCGSSQFNVSMTELLTSMGVPADRGHIKHDVWG